LTSYCTLLGRRVRVRNGKRTFVGILRATARRKFPRGRNRFAPGLVVEGPDFHFEFAWWDWDVREAGETAHLEAVKSS
jgi:hypothetical protein